MVEGQRRTRHLHLRRRWRPGNHHVAGRSAPLTQFGQVDGGLAGLGRPARWGGLSDMFGGFDRRFPAPPESYENYFKAYHMSRFGGRERKDVSYGGTGA